MTVVSIESHDQELQATHNHSLVTESSAVGHYNQIHLQLKAMIVADVHFDSRTSEQLLIRLDRSLTVAEVFFLAADHR